MKRKIFPFLVSLFTLLMLTMPVASSFNGSLQWDHDGVNVDGFKVYYTNRKGNYVYTIVGNVRTCSLGSLVNLKPGYKYTFYVTAYNEQGESGPSNLVYLIRRGSGLM